VRSAVSIHSYELSRRIICVLSSYVSVDREFSAWRFPRRSRLYHTDQFRPWAFKKNLFARDDAFLSSDGTTTGGAAS